MPPIRELVATRPRLAVETFEPVRFWPTRPVVPESPEVREWARQQDAIKRGFDPRNGIQRIASQDALGASTTTSVSATYPATTGPGNLLISTVYSKGANPDAQVGPSGWTPGPVQIFGTSSLSTLGLYYKLADGTESVISASDAAGTIMKIHIYEYQGNANPIVTDGGTTLSNTGASGTSLATPNVTTTAAGDLVFVACGESAANVTTPAWTNSFTLRQVDAAIRLFDGDQVVPAPGTYNSTGSWVNASICASLIIAFKAAFPGGFAAQPLLMPLSL